MGGLKSRRKGMAFEYEVRDQFRVLGHEAHRVPASGAAQGFKGDVHVNIKGIDRTFKVEAKRRKSSFKHIYELYDTNVDVTNLVAFRFHLGVGYITSDVSNFTGSSCKPAKFVETEKVSVKFIKNMLKLVEMIHGCDMLAIRDDRKQTLYIGFTGDLRGELRKEGHLSKSGA